ncbi:uncharacterized protein LOC117112220 [Anneissia japonica]|uniref:uncharacterized protein LOC117112220 n=1 Tax=Anneissia japonica TaxID=1529436 RepID=UPI00142576EE|nr:uncharacterized protein LOC117112220 [Anneissia japonica]
MAETHRFQFQYFEGMQKMGDTPYYIGNTLAADVLKLGLNEADPSSEDVDSQLARDYNILFAGVGDLRNLLLTTASLPSNFTGNIRYTLNDIDPFLLARDVLLLYMLITQSSRESIEESITNIWYSVKLPDEDFHLLRTILKEVLEHTVETLKVKTNSQLDIQKKDFEMMKEVWRKWTDMECETCKWNSVNLSAQRSSMFSGDPDSSDGLSTYIQKIPQKYRASAIKYFENGLFLLRERSHLKFDNPTLTGRPLPSPGNKGSGRLHHVLTRPKLYNFVYCIRADIWPFSGWDYVQAKKISQPDSIVDLFHTYITSVIKSALAFFKKGNIYSKFVLKNCIELCNEPNVEPKFDRIMTSNIADYTGIRTLLSSMRPLLSNTNKHAVLVTETLNWVRWCPEADLMNPLNMLKVFGLLNEMVKDTGRHDLKGTIQIMYDYFDNTTLFIRYLRIVLLATNDEPTMKKEVPSFPKDFDNIEGFRLRDFTKDLNKVIPFRHRVTARLCNNETGLQRNLEWKLL